MFLREALRRCAEIEEEIAGLYDDVAAQHAAAVVLTGRWTELACRERGRARLLRALEATQGVGDDDGPFLVHVPLQLAGLRRVVEEARRYAGTGLEPAAAVEMLDRIEAAERGAVYQSLLELSRPELVRMLRLLDNEVVPSRSDRAALTRLREAATAYRAEGSGAKVGD